MVDERAPLLLSSPRNAPNLLRKHVSLVATDEPLGFFRSLWNAVRSEFSSIMLVFVPLGFLAYHLGWGDKLIFIFNFMAIIPLAALLGKSTEEIGCRTSQSIAGLLNATFGNAVELIVGIIALQANLLDVVKASLLGSIISNLLLVFGMACFFGGLKFKVQKFSVDAAGTTSSLLSLTVLGVLLPAAITAGGGESTPALTEEVLKISRYTSVIILFMYFAFLYFQLVTHKDSFESVEDEETADVATMSLPAALFLLCAVTVLVSFSADYLVGSIEAVSEEWGLPRTFIGIILLPIVGNAAEHVTAIIVAMKNKMNLALAVVIGSSLQIAMSVIPVLVLAGWIMGRDLGLNFKLEQSVVLFMSTLLVNLIDQDGASNW
eukprot:CAMPEP_0184644768 /NCGR_PEP_ID=MMETSP0308-20130426/1423_1 /TAXON_ID=38269 /ORGANISM="Gloeochaete witrockiana, Strain SAG 46.84" /LENGTH=376 /DNA_ID=CAMNT_0027073471 /DNA_START=1 /DNA_END=1128 /DNA_ORIENTATION=+